VAPEGYLGAQPPVDRHERAERHRCPGGFEVEGLERDHYRRRDGRLRSRLLMARRLDGQ
jgi:hypothetical protein